MVKTLSSNWIISQNSREKINQLLKVKYQPVQSKVIKQPNTIGHFVKLPNELGFGLIHNNRSGYSLRGFN